MFLFALQNKLFTKMFPFWVDIKKTPTHTLKASGSSLGKGITVFICMVQSRQSFEKLFVWIVFTAQYFLWLIFCDI